MARPDKAAAVAEITAQFRDSTASVLTEYRGLTVSQLKQLRTSLGPQTSYTVVKNTLSKIAVRGADMPADTVHKVESLLEGPTAIAFIKGDPVEAAKGLRDFSRSNPLLVVKGGVLQGRALGADEIRRLADLESRDVLLAKLAGAMNASMSKAAALFQAPLAQAARLAEALRAKVAEQGGQDAVQPAAAEASEVASEAPSEVASEAPSEVASDAPTAEAPAASAPADGDAEGAAAASETEA